MSRRRSRSRPPLYPPIMLRSVPFALPRNFLQQLGYDRAVAAPRPMPSDLLPLATRWAQHAARPMPISDDRRPRRFVGLWWEPTMGELGWTDGLHTGLGQLDRQVWLAWLHAGRPLGLVAAGLIEHEICLDGSVSPERGPTHWLLVDRDRNHAWVAILGLARKIVRLQRFDAMRDI